MKFFSFVPIVALLCLCGPANAQILGFNITAIIEQAIKAIFVELSKILWDDWPVSRLAMESAGIVAALKLKYPNEFAKLPQQPPSIEWLAAQEFDYDYSATFGGLLGDGGNGGDGLLALIFLRLLGFQAIGVLGRDYIPAEYPARFAKDVSRILADAKIVNLKTMSAAEKQNLATDLERAFTAQPQFDTDIYNFLSNPPQSLLNNYIPSVGSAGAAAHVANFVQNPNDNTNPIFIAIEAHRKRENQGITISNYNKFLVATALYLGVKIIKPTGNDAIDLAAAKREMDRVKNLIAVLDAVAGKGSAGNKIIDKAEVLLKVGKTYENHQVKRNDGNNTPTDVVAIDMRSFEDHIDAASLLLVVTPNVVITINGFRANIPAVILGQQLIEYYHVIPEPMYTQAIAQDLANSEITAQNKVLNIVAAIVIRNIKPIATVTYDPNTIYKDANLIRTVYQDLESYPLTQFLTLRQAGTI